jgi:hypothetical protein
MPLPLLQPFVLVIWWSLRFLMYPENLWSPHQRGHILCFFPPQREYE